MLASRKPQEPTQRYLPRGQTNSRFFQTFGIGRIQGWMGYRQCDGGDLLAPRRIVRHSSGRGLELEASVEDRFPSYIMKVTEGYFAAGPCPVTALLYSRSMQL